MVDVSQFLSTRASALARRSTTTVPRVHDAGAPAQGARVIDFTNGQIFALFCVLALITSIPILLYPWPPLADYMNHLSRMHIIATVDSDPYLSRFYEVNWQIIPNLVMDLIVPVLERVMNVYLAGQIFTIMSFVLILSGTLALNRRLFGHWSVLPLIAFPFLYNNVFLVGTMNYVFGIGLSLWALAAWVWLRERRPLLRFSVSTAFIFALFFCHLFAVGLYGLGLLAFELNRLRKLRTRSPARSLADFVRNPPWPGLLDFVASGLPFLPVLPLLLMSPTWGLRGTPTWEFYGKLDGIIYVVEVYSHFAALFLTAVVCFAVGWGVRHRALQFHSFGWALLIVGGIIYLAMPRIMFETYMSDQRLPISLAFMVTACAHLNLRHDYVRRGFATVLVLMMAVRVFEVQTVWADLSSDAESFHESVRHVERGAKILVAYADADSGEDVRDLGLVHGACLAIIEKSALVTTAFTVVGKQVLHVRKEFRGRVDTVDGIPPSVNDLVKVAETKPAEKNRYWAHWTTDYDYVYVLFTDSDYENPDPDRLSPVYAGERFILYRIHRPHYAEAGNIPD